LIAWQVAVQLRDCVYRLTDQGTVLKDWKFRDQLRDAACSAPRNIAEGFGRFDPPEFARFVNFARGSLAETQSQLIHGRDRGYFSEKDFKTAWRLACRALRASNGLHAYLRRCRSKKSFTVQPSEPTPPAPREPEPGGTK